MPIARCRVCGRPPQAEIDAARETLLPREIACQGCQDDFKAALLTRDAKGNLLSADQAMGVALAAHEKRELAAYLVKFPPPTAPAKTAAQLWREALGV